MLPANSVTAELYNCKSVFIDLHKGKSFYKIFAAFKNHRQKYMQEKVC